MGSQGEVGVSIRRKIPYKNELKEAELIDVQQAREEWNQYLLADGSVVKIKIVVTEVWRIEREYDGDGNPVYIVRSGNVMGVTAPDALRKPTTPGT